MRRAIYIAICITIMIINTPIHASIENPLVRSSDNYTVELSWEPSVIAPNSIIVFYIKITPKEDTRPIVYDFIVRSNDTIVKEVNDVMITDESGITSHTVEFPYSGTFNVVIKLGDDALTFDVLVAPEFPSTIIVTIVVVSIAIILSRIGYLINNSHHKWHG